MNGQQEFDFEQRRQAASAEVIGRIKKLLRLAADKSNRHEAELALQRAFELARKYDVDVESLDLDERTARITHEWFDFSKRATFLEVRAMNVVILFFRVTAVAGRGRVVFIGLPTDIAIAHYVFEFIVRAGKRELKSFEIAERKARRKMSTNKRKNFLEGFIYGIAKQLRKSEEDLHIEDAQKALVIAEEKARTDYKAELCPGSTPLLRDVKRRNRTALVIGFIRGQESTIHQPLEDVQRRTLALTA